MVLAFRRRRTLEGLVVLGLGAVAFVPQLTWILTGMGRPGFASGTTWIKAPRGSEVWVLLTTVFSAGGLEPRSDGFAWTSSVGVALVVVLVLSRRHPPAATPRVRAATEDPLHGRTLRFGCRVRCERPVAGAGAGRRRRGAGVGVFVVSQVVHIWTLRNMIVVLPALTWGTVWVATALPRRERERQVLAVVVLVAMLVALGTVASDLRHPYKTDWRGVIRYLAQERAKHPSTTFSFFGSDPVGPDVAADRGPVPDAYLRRINSRVDKYPSTVEAIEVCDGYAAGRWCCSTTASAARRRRLYRAIRARLADPSCRRVPIYGLVVVSCP